MTVPITLNNLANLQNQTTAVNTINGNNGSISTAFSLALDTNGDKMNGNLDMNNNRILNLPSPLSTSEPVSLSYMNTYLTTGKGVTGLTGVPVSAAMQPVVNASTITSAQSLFLGNTVSLGPSGAQLILNKAGTTYPNFPLEFDITFTGSAGPTNPNSGGIIVIPTLGSSLIYTGGFYSAFTAQIGQITSIPAGTKGMYTGYEANIASSQNLVDMIDSGHGYGATITNNGSAQYDVLDGVININGNNSVSIGVNLDFVLKATGTKLVGVNVSIDPTSTQSSSSAYAFQANGLWTAGLALNGLPIINCTSMSFSAPNTVTVLYSIDGHNTDIFRIFGGGNATGNGGILLYTQSGTGNSGSFYVRNNSVDNTNMLFLDSSGNLTTNGNVIVSGGAFLLKTTAALQNNAGSSTATLTNAPAGTNPTKWIGINDNGVVRSIPAW